VGASASTGAKSNTAKQRWLKKNKFGVVIYPSTMKPLIQDLIIGRVDAFFRKESTYARLLSAVP